MSLTVPFFSHAAIEQPPLLIKGSGSTAVYWVKDGARRPFPLLSVYASHFGTSFKGVTEVSLVSLSQYPLGPSVTFKKGSLIKIQTDPKVYEVTDERGSIQWIKSEEEFLSRGFSFKQIQDVPDAFFPDYKIVTMLTAPPAGTPPPAQDFTTPTSTVSSTPSTPAVLNLNLESISVQQKKTTDGAKTSFNFATTLPARAEINVGYEGGVTSTISLPTAKSFSKDVVVLAGSTYNYSIFVTNDAGLSATSTGSFMSYADITAKATSGAVVSGAPLLKPLTTIGGITVTNNSSEKRYLNSMVLGFFSATNVTTNVSKTLSVYRSNGGVLGDLLMQRNFANGTSILNSQNQQTLTYEDTLAPGESKSYLITLSNLDNLNMALINGTETFETRLIRLDSLGDTTVGLSSTPLGILLHKKP